MEWNNVFLSNYKYDYTKPKTIRSLYLCYGLEGQLNKDQSFKWVPTKDMMMYMGEPRFGTHRTNITTFASVYAVAM